MLARLDWYAEQRHRAARRRPGRRRSTAKPRSCVRTKGREVHYDYVVLATGSYPVRAAGPGHRQAGRVRLPHDRGPGADHRLRRERQARGGHRRRAARPGSRQGRLRPGPGNARRRVRPAADAAAGRRRRLADAGRQDRGAGRPGPPQQEHEGGPRQRQGAKGWRSPTARRSTSRWSSSRPASARATSWPEHAA